MRPSFTIAIGSGYRCARSGAMCLVIGLLLGILTLRLRGPYFAIAMLAFSELARDRSSWPDLTLGGKGFPAKPESDQDDMSFLRLQWH